MKSYIYSTDWKAGTDSMHYCFKQTIIIYFSFPDNENCYNLLHYDCKIGHNNCNCNTDIKAATLLQFNCLYL